jgi:hypothetical protein
VIIRDAFFRGILASAVPKKASPWFRHAGDRPTGTTSVRWSTFVRWPICRARRDVGRLGSVGDSIRPHVARSPAQSTRRPAFMPRTSAITRRSGVRRPRRDLWPFAVSGRNRRMADAVLTAAYREVPIRAPNGHDVHLHASLTPHEATRRGACRA